MAGGRVRILKFFGPWVLLHGYSGRCYCMDIPVVERQYLLSCYRNVTAETIVLLLHPDFYRASWIDSMGGILNWVSQSRISVVKLDSKENRFSD